MQSLVGRSMARTSYSSPIDLQTYIFLSLEPIEK